MHLLDCTFLDRKEALRKGPGRKAEVVGIYCMVTMLDDSLWFAEQLRATCQLLVAGGPLPTCDPVPFWNISMWWCAAKEKQTMPELLRAYQEGTPAWAAVAGIVYRTSAGRAKGDRHLHPEREFTRDLDRIPFPAASLLPNEQLHPLRQEKVWIFDHHSHEHARLPFRCEFCSNVVFGGSYRERSPENVVDEIEACA